MSTSTWRTFRCDYDGEATVNRSASGGVSFIQADPKIHIADELIDQTDLDPILFATYKLGSWCDEARAWHADLIDTNPTHERHHNETVHP